MRDFEFIHAEDDVPALLNAAAELGLVIRNDHPTLRPESDIVESNRISNFKDGVFMLYRPEWVFGELQHFRIPSGYDKGKYFQSPSTNCIAMTLYFAGERDDERARRLGGGCLSRNINWYRPADHTVQPAPLDVKLVFDAMRKRIDTGKRLRGGVHNYAVLEGAWQKLTDGSAVPPFDYIEWPPPSPPRGAGRASPGEAGRR